MAPYCAIPRDYLSDTPLLRAMGFLVSQHGQLGAIPPPPFLSASPLESMRSGGAIPPPPPQKGYLSNTCAIPDENKETACDTPLCDTILKGYCAMGGGGGISHWASKLICFRFLPFTWDRWAPLSLLGSSRPLFLLFGPGLCSGPSRNLRDFLGCFLALAFTC